WSGRDGYPASLICPIQDGTRRMPDPVGLMQALLGPDTDRSTAEIALRRALASGVDPLHWCAVHCHCSSHKIMQRAANWSDVPFRDAMPETKGDHVRPMAPRMSQLSEIRLVTHRSKAGAVAYVAPDFFGVLRIAGSLERNPALRGRLNVVPYDVLRDHLIAALSPDLVNAS